nr:hypothetical protein [Tanacetum cinerariifolium]
MSSVPQWHLLSSAYLQVAEGANEVHDKGVSAAGTVAEGDVSAANDEDAGLPMDLLQTLMDTCITLTRRFEQLELDKIAQALEITKLKQRVKKLEKRNKLKLLKLRRIKRVRSAQRIDTSDDIVMDDDVAVEKSTDIVKDDQDADV